MTRICPHHQAQLYSGQLRVFALANWCCDTNLDTDFVTSYCTTVLLVSNKSACQRSGSIEILYYTRGWFLL
jgi:hypothetical protein